MPYYLIDFTASTSGTVRVKAKSKKEAWDKLHTGLCSVDYQIEDQMDNTKAGEFDYEFDKRSIIKDDDQESGPGQEDE